MIPFLFSLFYRPELLCHPAADPFQIISGCLFFHLPLPPVSIGFVDVIVTFQSAVRPAARHPSYFFQKEIIYKNKESTLSWVLSYMTIPCKNRLSLFSAQFNKNLCIICSVPQWILFSPVSDRKKGESPHRPAQPVLLRPEPEARGPQRKSAGNSETDTEHKLLPPLKSR